MKATELCPAGTVSQVGMLYRSKSRSLGKGLLAGALMTAALAAALPSYCQVWVVHHNFNLQLTAKQVYRVAWKGDVDILARDKGGVDSLTQTQLFGPALAPAADILGPKVVIAPLFGAFSTAYSQFSAAANGTGFHEVGGNLGVFPPVGILAVSSASSAIGLNVGAVDGKGRIKWQPNWHFDRIGKTKIKDPIDFSVLNLDTGALMESRLLEIDAEDEDGSASWENGRVQINGGTGSFTVLLTSPFITSGQGIMRLSYVNGVVVDSGVHVGPPAEFTQNLNARTNFIKLHG